ncbi:Gfo/Idh/MocA family protein [Croceibacterium aestuarii]|uniref:Gfo/Idh/MocA family protein n=1 Tax=Croceibacterium aestuarii TaxID=3064139 RepID=UPI00272DDA5F|nr:Gfo/Idh/MocA family oxidoreductase [Croceibacterium sp. D39]
MSDAPIHLALVGLGKIAHDQHLPAIAGNPDFALAATVDPASEGLADTPHFSSLESLLASAAHFDAVALCTPPQVRHDLARSALGAGKHLLLEKPPGRDPADVADLLAMAGGATVFAAWHSRFAAGVGPARRWLEGKAIRSVTITWREDVRVWHPGQPWIFQAGGFGVFDPGINALSIATAILPRQLEVASASLDVPANCEAPIAARLELRDSAGVPVRVDLDFLQTGPQTWDIRIETAQGELLLSKGGSAWQLPGERRDGPDREYARIYRRFAELIGTGTSEVDAEPLRLVAEALRRGQITRVADFHE